MNIIPINIIIYLSIFHITFLKYKKIIGPKHIHPINKKFLLSKSLVAKDGEIDKDTIIPINIFFQISLFRHISIITSSL